MDDVEAVRGVIARVSHFVDRKQWAELRSLFADTVITDYVSLFGGSVQEQPADSLVAGWRAALEPLDATQHLLGPIDLQVTGDRAGAECHVRAEHYCSRLGGGEEWVVSGHYVFELVKSGGAWRIRKMTLQTFRQTGNRNLLRDAAATPG